MEQSFLEKLQRLIPKEDLLLNEPMKNHTTFRVGGAAEVYVRPDKASAGTIVKLCKEENVPCMVIGNGSNLLVSDKGISGVVLEIGKRMAGIEVSDDCITLEAGVLLSAAAKAAADHSLSGLEFAAGIPGTVGGAVVMNAGAYDGEMKHVLTKVKVLTPEGECKVLTPDELELSYRHSIIPEKQYLVVEATVKLQKSDRQLILDKMAELKEKRIEKQPLNFPSAGSTFKRPEGNFAGKLIMDAGLRGFRVGGAMVSEKHCGFVINYDNATADDIYRLIGEVGKIVKEKTGICLEPEVKILGDF